jgi:hypothetical protein
MPESVALFVGHLVADGEFDELDRPLPFVVLGINICAEVHQPPEEQRNKLIHFSKEN